MANAYAYSNVAVAGAIGNSGGISNSATSMYLAATPVGYPGSFAFKLVLDSGTATEEIVKVTAGAGTSGSPWTIVRGWDGTTAQAHALGATVTHMGTAEDWTLSRTHEALVTAGSGAHGLPASAWVTAAFAALDETTISGSTTAAVTWSSIPATYKHLLVIAQGKFTETTDQVSNIAATLNGDGSASYSWVNQACSNESGAGTGALAGGQNTQAATTYWPMLILPGALAGSAANAGGGWALLPNYTSTTFNKCFQSLSGAGYGTGALVSMAVRNGWYNPSVQAAINSITLTASGGRYFVAGTFLGLYGLS